MTASLTAQAERLSEAGLPLTPCCGGGRKALKEAKLAARGVTCTAETYATDNTAVYVDVAQLPDRPHTFVAVVIRATDGSILNACSLRAPGAEQAEEVAIALALRSDPDTTTILSDSRSAITNFARSSIGETAAGLLPTRKSATTTIRSFPAHVGPIAGGAANRNETADAVARELAHRAAPPCASTAEDVDLQAEPLTTYGDILS
ncbi:hypothetical protein HPB48_017162 [Haemaphysalis longicornis]|uniref:Uncharacterized protein n=1 Tax=Haemaphysalis longicornis TaxID=44386 RepID=A0A9J6GLK1_HAELO|nr:hypothetical protein HPB48_017162 [Haemaphysalis longicornis]